MDSIDSSVLSRVFALMEKLFECYNGGQSQIQNTL